MAAAQPPRNATRVIEVLRNFLAGREIKPNLRYQDFIVKRSGPPPKLPSGPAHRLNKNYYYTRDLRREARPPVEISKQALLPASSEIKRAETESVKTVVPGQPVNWSENPY
ncbi:NADH dehydrogenase [ubiquinone] 1 alpha subcomplex subunit 7 [Trichoplax sp. H2]|uniref:NADH dehydrogenase [ubiquinone] 1 alpha subcomplex subunit 7 n=1 Tax=Trichoplax adhaerens TaxID=10228 RepID=B3S1S9_TRIAD|nr:expressed hypothetical protein [Trichoplax adhaerens]EDV23346.1 expressed hypothetical protein [Trichoplax adhaerens]RDD46187.1 NADH dehydrogenase [ubiquinone] 1 alpha subcomplex subunit 7 [Trichoplax sp. H2]|eukprot:XP_002114256.1 expressed hypothetical protein [Trichoplax adhaerens]